MAHPASRDGNTVAAEVVTEVRRKEALIKTGALQDAIFNSANFSSIATDEKGVIQLFNVGAERMLGYAAAEVLNKITPAEISDPQELIARAGALSAELGTTITPGFDALVFKASREIEDIYELTYIRKDGSRFPAVVSVTALRDDRGAIIGYLLIGTDNTARKQVEEEQKKLDQRLRDQQFYTRSLIESNIDALMTTDPRGIITDVNKQMEALTGRTRDELIGAPFKNYFTDPERAEAAIKLVLSEKKVTDFELTACARDGKKTEVSYNATTFYDRDRTLQGVFAAARDVTERKRNEQALLETNAELETAKSAAEKANLAKSDFLSSMSHELRSPLNAILGFAQLMESAAPAPTDSQKESIAQILRAGWHLLELINQVLDLAVIESGKVSMSPEPVSLARGHVRMPGHDGARGAAARRDHDLPPVRHAGLRHGGPDPPQADRHQPALQRDQVQQGAGDGRRGVRREHPGAHAHQRQRHRRGIVAGKAGAAVPAVQPARTGGGRRGRHGHRTRGHQATRGADGGRARRGEHRRHGQRVLVRAGLERRAARRRRRSRAPRPRSNRKRRPRRRSARCSMSRTTRRT